MRNDVNADLVDEGVDRDLGSATSPTLMPSSPSSLLSNARHGVRSMRGGLGRAEQTHLRAELVAELLILRPRHGAPSFVPVPVGVGVYVSVCAVVSSAVSSSESVALGVEVWVYSRYVALVIVFVVGVAVLAGVGVERVGVGVVGSGTGVMLMMLGGGVGYGAGVPDTFRSRLF